jgi:hypothetical protein
MRSLRPILSLLFLLTFLFPQVEKGVHELEHAAESHCTDTDLHFCASDHNCDLCDYQLTPSTTPSVSHAAFSLLGKTIVTSTLENVFVPQESKYNLTLRGPPAA